MYNKLIISAITLVASLFSSSVLASGPDIERIWTFEGLKNPESVVYDINSNALYVSNVNGSPNEKDGNGYISKISLDGKLIEDEWVTGLHAPKGLAIYNNTLYVADIDTLVEIDIPGAAIIERHTVGDAKFLNDVTATDAGDIYVSDMVLNRIHRLRGSEFSIWLEDAALLNPNGLLIEGNKLIVGAWGVMTDGFSTEVPGHILKVSLTDKTISDLGDGQPVGNLDGVESDGHGGYFVTDWMAGKLLHIDAAANVTVMLELEQGMADHEVLLDQKLILLPMMNNNELLAYRLK